MASGELPSWGDDIADAGFLDPAEEVQLAEDLFDLVARDGLVEFFRWRCTGTPHGGSGRWRR